MLLRKKTLAEISEEQQRMSRIKSIATRMQEIANGMIVSDATNGLDDYQLLEACLLFLKEEHAYELANDILNKSFV